MASLFLTDPDAVKLEDLKPKKESGNKYIRFKERVCLELQALGLPIRTAEVAVIDDFGGIMKRNLIERIGPIATAEQMLAGCEKIYKSEGKWHYG